MWLVAINPVPLSEVCSQGSRLQVECSFDEHGQYSEGGKEWENMTVNSVSVIAPDCDSPDSVYTITAENLSAVRKTNTIFSPPPLVSMQDMYDSLMEYLQTRGIDQKFAHDIFQYYRVFEHRCYLQYGLKALQNFLNST